MINNNQAKDLFQLQTELIDMKVDMAVSKASDRVLESIANLKIDMSERFTEMSQRLIAVETKLGMVNETEKEIKARVFASETHTRANYIDYTFKTGWLALGTIVSYCLVHFHIINK
jgi:hypothetical protein